MLTCIALAGSFFLADDTTLINIASIETVEIDRGIAQHAIEVRTRSGDLARFNFYRGDEIPNPVDIMASCKAPEIVAPAE
jgi:hypothetical protein